MGQPQIPPPATDRWNVNLPAVIGVVFVFLVGVVVWVIVASGDDADQVSESTVETSAAPTSTSSTTSTTSVVPGTTTPAPMPPPTPATSTTLVATPTTPAPPPPTPAPAPTAPATTTAPTTTVPPTPPTTAVGAEPDAVPGDLAIPGYPMQAPPCNDSFITVIASAVGADVAAEGILEYLEDYPTSNYLRTDQTCPSLAQNVDGEPIYVVFFGPFPFAEDACAARSEGTEGSYARILSETESPTHAVPCPE